MSSVLGNGYGFNSGNQVRNELRTIQNRIDQLATTLKSLKDFLIAAQPPEKKEEIETIFNNVDSTSAPAPAPAPPTPPPRNVVNPALNRVRA
jgi:hypothetical protein